MFEAFGVELEYMMVAKDSLNVLPVCDRLIEAECGSIKSEIERGRIAWRRSTPDVRPFQQHLIRG